MKKSILQLVAEVDLNNFKSELSPVGENETVIGQMSHDLQKIYALYVGSAETARSLHRGILAKATEHAKLHADGTACTETCKANAAELEKMVREVESAKNITEQFQIFLSVATNIEFPGLVNTTTTIGVREGFKIVKEDISDDIGAMLAGLFVDSLNRRRG